MSSEDPIERRARRRWKCSVPNGSAQEIRKRVPVLHGPPTSVSVSPGPWLPSKQLRHVPKPQRPLWQSEPRRQPSPSKPRPGAVHAGGVGVGVPGGPGVLVGAPGGLAESRPAPGRQVEHRLAGAGHGGIEDAKRSAVHGPVVRGDPGERTGPRVAPG
jgi:hypothetical protein